MIDSFIIGAYWGLRPDSLNKVKEKVIRTLNSLSQLDQHFTSWYETAINRKEALKKKVELKDSSAIEKLCLKKIKSGELDEKGFAKIGFVFSLWSGHEDEETSSITFSVGSSSKWLLNSCVISLPDKGSARERLLQPQTAIGIIKVLSEIWNPDYAVLTSESLRDKLEVGNKIGWVTYTKEIKQVFKFSNKIFYKQTPDGHLFYPVSTNFDDVLMNELFLLKNSINR